VTHYFFIFPSGISEPMDVSLEPPAAELLVVAAPSQQKKTRAPRRRREKVAAPTRPALESRKAKVDARVLITHIFNDRNASIPRESAKRAKLVEVSGTPLLVFGSLMKNYLICGSYCVLNSVVCAKLTTTL